MDEGASRSGRRLSVNDSTKGMTRVLTLETGECTSGKNGEAGSRRPLSQRDGLQKPHANAVCCTGAMGGGSTARFKWRRIFWMTRASIIAAMIRSLPCWHTGQRSMSIEKTRLSNWAQLQFDEVRRPWDSSAPCWRGVGVRALRSLLCGAKHPP
jgi:hypothetical protein